MSVEQFDLETFEENNELELIEVYGEGPWSVSTFFNRTDGYFYIKGPLARWDSICYQKLNTIRTRNDLALWVEKMKDLKVIPS